MNETTVTVVGNIVDNPALRRTESGVDVANFRVASTSRRYDRASESWVDHGTLFLGVTCWRGLAVNVVGSLSRGDPVLVTGRLHTRSYEVNGQPRSSYEVDAFAVGPDLARGTAVFQRSSPTRAAPADARRPDPAKGESAPEPAATAA